MWWWWPYCFYLLIYLFLSTTCLFLMNISRLPNGKSVMCQLTCIRLPCLVNVAMVTVTFTSGWTLFMVLFYFVYASGVQTTKQKARSTLKTCLRCCNIVWLLRIGNETNKLGRKCSPVVRSRRSLAPLFMPSW